MNYCFLQRAHLCKPSLRAPRDPGTPLEEDLCAGVQQSAEAKCLEEGRLQ